MTFIAYWDIEGYSEGIEELFHMDFIEIDGLVEFASLRGNIEGQIRFNWGLKKRVPVYLHILVSFKELLIWGCRHSSVDSSAHSIMPPQVRLPSTPSMLLSFIVKFVLYLYLCCEKEQK